MAALAGRRGQKLYQKNEKYFIFCAAPHTSWNSSAARRGDAAACPVALWGGAVRRRSATRPKRAP
jgi:hypothetical protein